jgi:hypothetical protein
MRDWCSGSMASSFMPSLEIVKVIFIIDAFDILHDMTFDMCSDFDFLSLKNDVNVPSKSNKQKNFVGLLKVNGENSRIRIRIRIH